MDGYSLHKVIGEGSFGRALLVQSKINNKKYVLKEIRLPKTQSKLTDSRREAVLLSRMKHPNIVAFRESFEADGHLYIVMEYCSGGDLLQRIKEQKTTLLQEEDILKWFAHMCAGTKHIHDKRVLHRDLKSKNIFLTDNGTVKLGDFGSACVLNSSKAHAYTYVGTPYYVSPEIWDNKPYNNKSDVWSLGCVLYELCTLRHPFQARSWKSLILKVCRGAYAPLPGHLPYELHYLVKHMFKTDPRDRPSLHTILTSHRVARLLRRHLPSQAVDEEKEKEEEGRTGRWRREEGEKVAMFLGQKSLLASSTCGASLREDQSESGGEPSPRKQWAKGPSDTVLQALGNASLLSSDSMTTPAGQQQSVTGKGPVNSLGSRGKRERRRWSKSPPERLLSLLEKADLSTAFRTYSIHKEGDHPLIGPLSQAAGGDHTDGGPEDEGELDEDRLEPRSDDEDTDFEDDSQSDWFDELEKLSLEH